MNQTIATHSPETCGPMQRLGRAEIDRILADYPETSRGLNILREEVCNECALAFAEEKRKAARRTRLVLWYVKEVNLSINLDDAQYATDFWRDLQDRVL